MCQMLNNALKSSRREHLHIHIKGVDELNIIHDSVMLEACNTSFQTHLQVNSDEFVKNYNLTQVIRGLVLSSCANSLFYLVENCVHKPRLRRLQSIDTDVNSFIFHKKNHV